MKLAHKVAIFCATGALAMVPIAAQAVTLNVSYDATGSSHINSTESDLWIKPTTLSIGVESADGNFVGHMPLHEADTKFHVLGLLPIKATVSFEEAAPVTGHLGFDGTAVTVQSQASYYIKLSDVLVAGLPAFAGNYCKTKVPVVIPANTPPGEAFDLTNGGHLVGEYTIGAFENCGLNTPLINLLVPGSGNTVELSVSNGHLG